MEFKNYQKKVMKNLSEYMKCIEKENNIISAWENYWLKQDICIGSGGVPKYNNTIKGVPHVCMKVPTGGGKTFMACSALRSIFASMPLDKPKVVIWLVPTDPILNQTTKTLSDVNHPYRQKLDMDFSGRVAVYTKEQLLNGQNFSPDTVREMMSVCILSFGSLRINSNIKDVRKVYQENGNLLKFAEYFKDKTVLLSDTPDTALIQVLRYLEPVVIVDESHNAGSDLSIEMLNNLNPSFILDLTATPRKNSNIISYIDARQLKKEHMVKLPVVVYNRNSRNSVIQDAIQLRGSIERQAQVEEASGGEYIRPIVLFQAQPRNNDSSDTYDKIKKILLDMGIPKEQIGIKTSEVDDIKDKDLLSKSCEIRYIITVNALKEGWDCPFAYILASLANKTSSVDVEQILGRILRQPYAKQHKARLLNSSYVLTSSNDFRSTLENIVIGLNKAGFSRKDFREGIFEESIKEETKTPISYGQQQLDFYLDDNSKNRFDDESTEDTFSDINSDNIKTALESTTEENSPVSQMIKSAEQQSAEYNNTLNNTQDGGFVGGELGDMLKQNSIQKDFKDEIGKLQIPQFYIKTVPDLFGGEYDLLEKENLSDGFSLNGQDAKISFELATGEIYSVDIQENGEAVPKYKKASKSESEFIREYLAKLPQEKKITQCINMICHQLNKNNRYATSEIENYVRRIVTDMTEDELSAMETAIPTYAKKIQDKIHILEGIYQEEKFNKLIDSGKISCQPSYKFPMVITPAFTTDSIPLSLYEAEKNDMNNFEFDVINAIVALDNIQWWHRVIERKGFRINGFINHYPDFIIKTKLGKIVVVETKGDDRDNSDSKTKVSIGRKWQALAGVEYRYFMVFKNKDLKIDGAYTFDDFIEIIKAL